MKSIFTVIILSIFTTHFAGKQVTINFNILPELKAVLKDQPIIVSVSFNNQSFDTILINPNSLIFKNITSSYFSVSVRARVSCNDGVSQKGYWTGERIDGLKNNTSVNITFPEDCEYNKYLGGKICPKCLRTDQSIKSIWGLPSPDLPGEPGVDYALGSCIRSACDPSWFCKRDSVEF